MWRATYDGQASGELPPLSDVARGGIDARRRAANMSSFFREVGAKGRSPVEFQIAKASDGELKYSRRSPLVDYLLYAEVWSGFLVGLHDREILGEDLVFGLAEEAHEPSFDHISRKVITLKPQEPVLIAGDRIVASLRHGPDYASRISDTTRALWGVLFASPSDDSGEIGRMATQISKDGVARGIWRLND
jgi:hypothetical protein